MRPFDGAGNIRADVAGDVLASLTTIVWTGPAKGWSADAPMDDANLNRRQTIRVGPGVACAQIGIVGFDGPIDLQALRLYGLPEAAPAVLNGTPLLSGLLSGSGRREFAAEVSRDLPSLAAGATSLLDATIIGARVGDLARASLATSNRFFELDATAWCNSTVRVLARNVSNSTIDLAAATLSMQVTERRVP
ncbi:MAG TPA: hypothetical protein VGN83_19195 [Falsiroseomonas sp.]|nr:hypothetical protein [Falsiroseomonas sp.]